MASATFIGKKFVSLLHFRGIIGNINKVGSLIRWIGFWGCVRDAQGIDHPNAYKDDNSQDSPPNDYLLHVHTSFALLTLLKNMRRFQPYL